MSIFVLLLCLLGADPPDGKPNESAPDPLEEVKFRLGELYGDDENVARDAYRRLQVITRSPHALRAAAARAAIADYDKLNGPLVLPGGAPNPIKVRKKSPHAAHGLLTLASQADFLDAEKQPRYASPHLFSLVVSTPDFGDDQLRGTAPAKNLVILDLQKSAVTGRDFAKLELPRLRYLSLTGAPVTDQSLAALKPAHLEKLEVLKLSGTQVTDKTLADSPFTQLGVLYFDGTAITREGVVRSLPRFSKLTAARLDLHQFDPQLFPLIKAGKLPLTQLRIVHTPAEDRAAIDLQKAAPRGLTVTLMRQEKPPAK